MKKKIENITKIILKKQNYILKQIVINEVKNLKINKIKKNIQKKL